MRVDASINLPAEMAVWPEGTRPHALPEDGELPRLTYYLPSAEFRTGQSVLVLPGGGYNMISAPKEGHRPAQWLAVHGVASAVLEYRHSPHRHPVPLIDAQRAMRILRQLAARHGLDSDRVGCLGFSAGGHLAGTVTLCPPHPDGLVGDAMDSVSCHADFAALIYPVTTFVEEFGHTASRIALLGDPPDPERAAALSHECLVTAGAPPFLLVHGQNDDRVPVANSLSLYAALTSVNAPATLHVYADLPHGVGLAANHRWSRDLIDWLRSLMPTGTC